MLNVEGLENVSVSALQGLGLGLVSWQKSDVSVSSRSHLGLAELQEGLGLGLVSDKKPNV